MSKIIGYKGILADGDQDKISLRTMDGKTGYRIVKFEIMSEEPYGGANAEHIVKIYKKRQTGATTAVVDFSDTTLLATALTNNATSGYIYPTVPSVIFDREIFNQDIYITHSEGQSSQACNYYIELEAIELSDSQATQLTLKNLRAVASRFA